MQTHAHTDRHVSWQ